MSTKVAAHFSQTGDLWNEVADAMAKTDPLELARQELKRGPAAAARSQTVVKVVTANVLTLHPSEERRTGHNFTARPLPEGKATSK